MITKKVNFQFRGVRQQMTPGSRESAEMKPRKTARFTEKIQSTHCGSVQSFAGFALLTSLARSVALIRLLARSLTPKLVGN